MITLQNLGDSILFTFEENDKYLHNGTISVPMNSLILVTDESGMATFRKAASNDIFVSALYSDFGMTKAELEQWYAENMVSEVTEEDVDEKIAEAVGEESDRAVSAETALSGAISAIDAAYKAADSVISGAVDNLSAALQNESQRAVSAETALSGAIDTKIDESAITSAITSASTDSEIPSAKAVYDALQESGLDEDTERLISGSLNDLNERKLDASAYTPTDLTNYYTKSETSGATEISTALASKADTATTYTKTEVDNAVTAATSTKQDTLVSGTNIKTINNESILGSGNITIEGGGGKAIVAGRGIAITTGETADTVSLNVINQYYGTVDLATSDSYVYNGSIMIGRSYIGNKEQAIAIGTRTSNVAGGAYIYGRGGIGIGNNVVEKSKYGIAIGYFSSAGTSDVKFSCCAIGTNAESYGEYSTALSRTKVNNESEFGSGKYNVSSSASTTFGDSGNTLFSVGNGTADNARHNAFEIRQNGDIYITKDGQDVKLQDQLGGGGSSYTAGDGIDITNDVISVTGKVDTSAITTSIASASTDTQVPSAKAVNDKLGGLSLLKITQAAYDALENKDANTLYIIVDEPPFSGKYKFTLTDDSVVSGACDSSSAITTAETSAYASTLKEAVIGDCVTSIGNEAFYGCTSLTSVTIPNSVTSISFYAFEGCSSLISINIPSSVTNIKDGAFSGCTSLTSITVNAATPPTLAFDAFVDTNNCPIYVPSASVEVYKTASGWSDYASRIQAIS